MGQTKREYMKNQQKQQIAEEIAIETGLLEKCEAHGYVISTGEMNVKPAYKFANSLYSKDSPRVDIFEDRNELTDCIKAVVENHGTTCPGCAKIERE